MSTSEFDKSSIEVLKRYFPENSRFEQFYNNSSDIQKVTLWTPLQFTLEHCSQLKIEGTVEKLKDIGSFDKLISIFSEIKFAEALAMNGHTVTLIPDNSINDWINTPPDMVAFRNDFNSIIEVMHWSPNDSDLVFYELLSPLAEKLNIIIEYVLPPGLSSLVVTYDERAKRDKDLERVGYRVIDEIEKIYRNKLSAEILVEQIKITIRPSEDNAGYVINPYSFYNIVPDEKYRQQFYHQLKRKAAKPDQWPLESRRTPYVIAVEIEQTIGQYTNLAKVLYGYINHVSFMKPDEIRLPVLKYPTIVQERLIDPAWSDFILSLGFDSGKRNYINRIGFFLEEPSASKVCGVLTLFRGQLEFYPNPFVDNDFLYPDICNKLNVHFGNVSKLS